MAAPAIESRARASARGLAILIAAPIATLGLLLPAGVSVAAADHWTNCAAETNLIPLATERFQEIDSPGQTSTPQSCGSGSAREASPPSGGVLRAEGSHDSAAGFGALHASSRSKTSVIGDVASVYRADANGVATAAFLDTLVLDGPPGATVTLRFTLSVGGDTNKIGGPECAPVRPVAWATTSAVVRVPGPDLSFSENNCTPAAPVPNESVEYTGRSGDRVVITGNVSTSTLASAWLLFPTATATANATARVNVDAVTTGTSYSAVSGINYASDGIAPTVQAVASPAPNSSGWSNEDTTVSLAATDNDGGSGIREISYRAAGAQPIDETTVGGASASVPITTEGETTITYSAKDNLGNGSDAKTITVKIDKRDPTAEILTPSEGAEYEYGQPVQADYACADQPDGSGLISCEGDSASGAAIDTFPLGSKSFTVTAQDRAGNTVARTARYRVVDTTPPELTIPDNILTNATSPQGAEISYSAVATDAADTDPTVSCGPGSGSTFPIGSTTVNCTATDASGNTTSKSFDVKVKSASEQLNDLVDKVLDRLGLPAAIATRLSQRLKDAAAAILARNPGVACRILDGFKAAVRTFATVGLIPAADAQELSGDANRMRAVLAC